MRSDLFANRDKNTSAPSAARGTTVSRGSDPQKDWMRWRQSDQAVLNLLNPDVKKQLLAKELGINITAQGSEPAYNAIFNFANIPSGLGANEIRHELTHAGLDLAPELFPNVSWKSKVANTGLGTLLKNTARFGEGMQFWAEAPAITMGGASAYPGYTPSNTPQDFGNFFNTQTASWQYPAQTAPQGGWNIGR